MSTARRDKLRNLSLQEDEYARREGETVTTTKLSKAISAYSSAACSAPTIIAARSILHRYLPEFDFRHNNRTALGVDDKDRASELAKGIVGKRLTHHGLTARRSSISGALPALEAQAAQA